MSFPLPRAVLASLLFLATFTLAACDSTDPEGPPGISAETRTVTGGRGTTVDIPLQLSAESGIASLTVTVDAGTPTAVEIQEGTTEQAVTYAFDIPAASVVGTTYELDFTLTAQDGATSTTRAIVTTGRLIEAPDTYVFTRDGASTVSYGGQTDRLNMVAEMKAYLQRGDRGEVLSEQVLLDMFENAGGDGGGNFSFTSDRQLKDKTFAPDLDDRLYENLFAQAAAASQAGSSGAKASNGTAGLLTRENSGNTILVDANGREFTQLIEKGLMGSVFYNQIYNVYLTDARIGPAVENVELVDGRNYTPMEHHWDEAFGYFAAPVDFTSPWPEARGDELRFWSNYSDVVDNVADGLLGMNELLMDAYINGRTAVVNNDRATLDAQRGLLYGYHELLAAATAVHYINLTLRYLDEGNIGEAFHTLSEAWAFTNALRYSPQRTIALEDIDEIMNTHYGAEGNFWNVTVAGLNTAKTMLVDTYPALAPVQDAL